MSTKKDKDKQQTNGHDVAERHTPENLLDMDTVSGEDRDWITIDKKKYYIRGRDEFSLVELHKLTKWGFAAKILGEIDEEKQPSEEELQRLSDRTHDLLDILFVDGLPDELDGKLTDGQRFRIIEVFIKRSGLLKDQEKSSQPSSDSTEATPSAG